MDRLPILILGSLLWGLLGLALTQALPLPIAIAAALLVPIGYLSYD